MSSNTRGFVTVPISVLVLLGIAIVGGGTYFFTAQKSSLKVNVPKTTWISATNGVQGWIATSTPHPSDPYPYIKNGSVFCNRGQGRAPLNLAVDLKTFALLSEYGSYTKDKDHVWLGCSLLENADPATFAFIQRTNEGVYARDSHHVWYGTTLIPNADPETFSVIQQIYGGMLSETYLVKDKSHVFIISTRPDEGDDIKELPNADPATFTLIMGNPGWEKPYSSDGETGLTHYWKDKNQVYFYDKVLPLADPKSFTLLTGPLHAFSYFSKDSTRVYYASTVLEGADPLTFEVLPSIPSDLAKDKNHVYLKSSVFAEADAPTFLSFQMISPDIPPGLTTRFMRDKNHVYFFASYEMIQPIIITNADATTFRILPVAERMGKAVAADKYRSYDSNGKPL